MTRIEMQYNGNTYSAEYTIEGGMITVSGNGGSKTTQVGGTPEDTLARMLLRELINEGKVTPS